MLRMHGRHAPATQKFSAETNSDQAGDDTSQHTVLANESVGLGSIDQPGGSPYLNIGLIVRVAVENRVHAIHPGYGYPSENADFATAVRNAGITFVGPSSSAMETLGDKRSARAYLREHEPSVPLIPGFAGKSQELVELARYFGSGDCIREKYMEEGKHIEIQFIGDSYGNVISFGERDCSVQMRHQKVIEESPSPWLDDAKRKEMCDVANAGTVEFFFDVATGNFYFLELFVASGGDLATLEPLQQLKSVGHAIERRLCAESPQRDFYPGHGIVRLWRPARNHDQVSATSSVRFEIAINTCSRISTHFDSMIAKIVVWELTRSLARAKMMQVLADTGCVGVGTNQLFLQSFLLHEKFSNPAYTTSFIPDNLSSLLSSPYAQGASQIASASPLLASYFIDTTLKSSQAAKAVKVMCHVWQLGTWIDTTCFSILSYFKNIREEEVGTSSEKMRRINASMPCKILSVLREAAQTVQPSEKVMVVESMKMEINIFASVEGVFKPMICLALLEKFQLSQRDTISTRAFRTRDLDHFQAYSKNVSSITRVNDSVVEQSRAGLITLAVSLHAVFRRLRSLFHGRTVYFFALGFGAIRLNRLHNAGQLVGPHDIAATNGPDDRKSRLIRSPAHGMIARTV
ncbi:hypothetical protein MAC_02889 [Metarhizium acridum CQMa 102]|uniref:Biotin carboxylation domain-containing protein n=1 Tax=Metarhizium acridum (strain CQMa 102) TaxID=655827 RepID=E9DZ41_METAQ|nr:uncharacterized protein MAC_02889 [Metarhizium acridum CQMa 102]EFY91003.1 hypothetical protein MAC_02889 [Metarhizium acridum CQMa 102]